VDEGVTPKFLSTDEVQKIHRLVAPFVPPYCDIDRLDSAVHAVESYAYYGDPDDLFDIAAAYAFYISEAQQVFHEGHKRTGVGACLSFLKLNGVQTAHYDDWEVFDWVLSLANKQIDRKEFAARLRIPFE
jgi:prophage maintenance system killer protein